MPLRHATRKRESKHQAEVIAIARANGWRIDLADFHKEHYDPLFVRCLKAIAPKGKLKPLFDYVFAKRGQIFTFAYHTHNSMYSQPGFPDLVLVHPRRQIVLFVELKRDGEYPTIPQRLWYAALSCVEDAVPDHVMVRIWRPSDREEFVSTLGGIDPYAH